jgi:hypothetical protein
LTLLFFQSWSKLSPTKTTKICWHKEEDIPP